MKTIFERPLRKVKDKNGRLKEYNISLGVKSQINEDRFHLNEKGIEVCEVIIGFPDEYEEFRHEHENFKSQILSLNESIEDKDETIKKLKDELSAIYSEHQKEMDEKDEEYSAKIDSLNDDLHAKDLQIERTKTEYERRIGTLKAEHQEKINALKLFDERSHMSIIDHQKEISDLKAKHQEEMDALEIFDEEKHMKINDYFKEISGIKDRISLEVIHHNDNMNSHEKNLNLRGFISGKHKSSYNELKEDIEAFRMIAQYIESRKDENPSEVKMKEADEDSS